MSDKPTYHEYLSSHAGNMDIRCGRFKGGLMNDKPTYRDYLFHDNGKYIRSGGQYYSIVTSKKRKIVFRTVRISFLVIVIGLLIWLMCSNTSGPNLGDASGPNLGDGFLTVCLITEILSILKYRHARFVIVPEGSDAYREASELQYSASSKVKEVVLTCVVLIILVPGSYTVSYIRSLADHSGGIVSTSIESREDILYSSENVTEENILVSVPDLADHSLFADITVTQSPSHARLMLDGQPLPDKYQPQMGGSTLFSNDYFKQSTLFSIPVSQLHDGSTLTLTCGDLRREWTFDLTP